MSDEALALYHQRDQEAPADMKVPWVVANVRHECAAALRSRTVTINMKTMATSDGAVSWREGSCRVCGTSVRSEPKEK